MALSTTAILSAFHMKISLSLLNMTISYILGAFSIWLYSKQTKTQITNLQTELTSSNHLTQKIHKLKSNLVLSSVKKLFIICTTISTGILIMKLNLFMFSAGAVTAILTMLHKAHKN